MTSRRTKKEVVSFLKRHLVRLVEQDPLLRSTRIFRNKVTEYTLQGIIWRHLVDFVDNSWGLSIETYVEELDFRADILMGRLTQRGTLDNATGLIAIEVKPHGKIREIERDLDKLQTYVEGFSTAVSFGALF